MAPPTPEKLEQDKKSIEEQFDRAFTLVEQLVKDTETLKKAEEDRTQKLDSAISEFETVMTDLKAANRRREDDAQRIRDEVQGLKDAIPKAMENQKQLTDTRLREVTGEMASLKTLVSQRMSGGPSTPSTSSSFLRGSSGSATTANASTSSANRSASTGGEKAGAESSTPSAPSAPSTPTAETPKPAETPKSAMPAINRASSSSLVNQSGKKSIPAWQMAMANQNDTSSTVAKPEEKDTAGSSS